MKTNILFPFLFLLLFTTGFAFSQSVQIDTIVDYLAVDKAIREKAQQCGAGNVLVVLDIDNTILTSDTDLGSDTWYQWQNDELDLKPTPEQKLTRDCLYNEAIGLLYDLGTMSLTDSLLPGYIKAWQSSGATLFALTSRSPKYRAATERELSRNNIDLKAAELSTIDGNELIFSLTLTRDLSYDNGIMMTTGMNKGEMLAYILEKAGRSFKANIFVDDTRKNIDAVKNKYLDNNNIDMILFHYTRIISDRLKNNNNVVLTLEQADKMDMDWDLLIRLLNTIFPERLEKSECSR